MSRQFLLALCSICFALVLGCQSKPKPVPPQPVAPPIDAVGLEAMRSAYAVLYPGSQVGVVSHVLSFERLAAVEGINTSMIKVDQVVTFIDSNQRVLTTGRVVRIVDSGVHVKFEDPPAGGRTPQTGDLMVQLAS